MRWARGLAGGSGVEDCRLPRRLGRRCWRPAAGGGGRRPDGRLPRGARPGVGWIDALASPARVKDGVGSPGRVSERAGMEIRLSPIIASTDRRRPARWPVRWHLLQLCPALGARWGAGRCLARAGPDRPTTAGCRPAPGSGRARAVARRACTADSALGRAARAGQGSPPRLWPSKAVAAGRRDPDRPHRRRGTSATLKLRAADRYAPIRCSSASARPASRGGAASSTTRCTSLPSLAPYATLVEGIPRPQGGRWLDQEGRAALPLALPLSPLLQSPRRASHRPAANRRR